MDMAYLIKQAKRGNDQAFEQLITSVRPKLYRTAYSYVRSEQMHWIYTKKQFMKHIFH